MSAIVGGQRHSQSQESRPAQPYTTAASAATTDTPSGTFVLPLAVHSHCASVGPQSLDQRTAHRTGAEHDVHAVVQLGCFGFGVRVIAMRVWLRLILVVLLVVFGLRAWMNRPAELTPAPVAPASPDAAMAGEAAASALRSAEQRSAGSLTWTVTRLNWADDILVVEVKTARPAEDARTIAEEIVEPLDDGYEEVLVYIRAPASANNPILHRIRWTPTAGYVEASFAER